MRQCKSHLPRVEARLHQRWVAATQRCFTTLDQRRTLGTPKDCGLADWRPAALLRTSPNSQTPRCCDRIRCFPPLKTLLHQYSGPLAAEHGAILPLWLSIAFFTRSKTVIGADLRSCSPSTPRGFPTSRSGGLVSLNTQLFHNAGSASHLVLAQRLWLALITVAALLRISPRPRTSRQPLVMTRHPCGYGAGFSATAYVAFHP